MKQLKVIVDSYNTKSGLIQASFGEPIIVKSGAKIALENFSLDVLSGTASDIQIENSTVDIYTNKITGANSSGPRSAILNSQVFKTSQDLMNALTNAFNSILISDYLYNINKINSPGFVRDIGLCFINYLSGPNKEFSNLSYSGVNADTTTAPILKNATSLGNNGYFGNFGTEWYIAFNKPIILGALSITFKLDIFLNAKNNFEWGITNTLSLTTPNLLQYGFRIKSDNQLYLVSNGVESLLDINLTPFVLLAYNHQFYVENGKLRYQIYDPDDNTLKFKTDAGVFSNFDFLQQNYFGMRGVSTDTTDDESIALFNLGITYQPAVQQNDIGWYLKPELLDTNVYLGGTIGSGADGAVVRTVKFDFTGASSLRAGLGLESNNKTINAGVSGNYAGIYSISFSSYFDLALEITNLPLQSWIANTNRIQPSRRVNILAYFTPQKISTGGTMYLYESRLLNFLSLNNLNDINIESLQFRVYNVLSPGSIIDCSRMTFNLFVTDDSEIHKQVVAL